MKTEDWKRDLVECLFAHKGVVVSTAALISLGAIGVALYWPPTFAASGSVLVRGIPVQVSPEALGDAELKNLTISKEDIATEVQILSSPELIRQLVQPEGGTLDDAVRKQVGRIQGSLATEVVPNSNVVSVRLFDRDPAWAEKTLDELLKRYVVFRAEVFHPSGQESFLTERAVKYKADLRMVEDQLVKASTDSAVTLPDRELINNVDLARDMKKQLGELQLLQTQKIKEARPLQQALTDTGTQYFAFLNMEAIDSMGSRLKDLKTERARIERSFQPDSARMKSLDENIRTTYEELHREVQRVAETRAVEIEGIEARTRELQEAIKVIETRNVELTRHASDMQRMNREAGLLAFSYETFSKRAEEARITSAISAANFSGEVSILSWARNSAALIFPQKALTIAIGLFVGLITGCSMALLLEFFDHTVKRPSDLSRFVGLPLICSIRKV